MKNKWVQRAQERPRTKPKEIETQLPKTYRFLPLVQTNEEDTQIVHKLLESLLFEIFVPAKVWDHRAVKRFRNTLLTNGFPGATILKTAVGLWQDMEEDTHLYRTLVSSKEANAQTTLTHWLQEEVGKTMAILAEWIESRQEEIWFTVTPMTVSQSILQKPPKGAVPAEPKGPNADSKRPPDKK